MPIYLEILLTSDRDRMHFLMHSAVLFTTDSHHMITVVDLIPNDCTINRGKERSRYSQSVSVQGRSVAQSEGTKRAK